MIVMNVLIDRVFYYMGLYLFIIVFIFIGFVWLYSNISIINSDFKIDIY